VVFEVKNMTDLANEEFFQLSARLDEVKGMFGILVARDKDQYDVQRALRRLTKERKVTLVITDKDLVAMLLADQARTPATALLQSIYRELIDLS
jgi:hypothetical protein